jgi:hypothetical protein
MLEEISRRESDIEGRSCGRTNEIPTDTIVAMVAGRFEANRGVCAFGIISLGPSNARRDPNPLSSRDIRVLEGLVECGGARGMAAVAIVRTVQRPP